MKMKFTAPDSRYFYTLLVTSLLTGKFLHLFSHLTSVPIFLFLLYLPTFLTLDAIVILGAWTLAWSHRRCALALCILITSASAAQIGFFIETGGEIRWNMMAKVLSEPEGFLGMLMTGFFGLLATNLVLAGLAWCISPYVYNIAGRTVRSIGETIYPRKQWFSESGYVHLGGYDNGASTAKGLWWKRVKLAVVVGTLVVLHIVRPKSPYGHMSTTLPFTLFDGLFARRSEFCDPSPDHMPIFPLKKGLGQEFWIKTKEEGGIGRGWTPGKNWWEVQRERPAWLPEEGPVPGFAKYYRKNEKPTDPKEKAAQQPPAGYDSVLDPLKISNLDQPVLEELRKHLKDNKVDIKHVVLVSLESTRKDVFPLVKGSILEQQLQESRGNPWKREEQTDEYADLTRLSLTAEALTGQPSGFEHDEPSNITSGGLNVQGALTGSTFTLKSLLGSHCGVSPLPVDFLEELEVETYQPCIPQILSVMNSLNTTPSADYRTFPWNTAFMQAATNKFDRQAAFMEQLGFNQTVVREDIQSPDAKHPPKGDELNYFGYSETELLPYIRDLFTSAEADNRRVFLSHLTSSTHHPWATPPEFGPQQRYWGDSRGGGTPWDRYLNSIRWGDQWLSTLLNLLDELNVADQTLVVLLGDHGFSFGDDSSSKTTYANSHINSFRIPMVFHHPKLPMAQVNATVTSMSILPTILDLLLATDSLSQPQRDVAEHLLPEYEGQSLIRPFQPSKNGRDVYNLGVVNPGGTHLSLTSSSHPYRLVIPICEPSAYTFSHLLDDPSEHDTVEDWDGGDKLRLKVETRWGKAAGEWVREAELTGGWLVWELRRRWGYWDGARREDRGAGHRDDGVLEHDHWWDT